MVEILQDRLAKELEVAGIQESKWPISSSMESIWRTTMPFFCDPRLFPKGALVPAGREQLVEILCIEEECIRGTRQHRCFR
jgi:hypothetical protein